MPAELAQSESRQASLCGTPQKRIRLSQLWHSLQVGVRGYTLLLLLPAKVALEVNSIALFGIILSIYGFYLEAHKKMERFLSYIRRIVPLCYFLKWILSVTTLMSFSPWGWMLKDTTI